MTILSESLEASSSSSPTYDHLYDVFLSFRGSDTRFGFTAHLHKALKDANINAFLDDVDTETAIYLKPEVESAIETSRVCIIVLSKNYAFSRWALDDLLLILEKFRKSRRSVIPILYHVRPNEVSISLGNFEESHNQWMKTETRMELWKESLIEVVNLAEYTVDGGLETEIIEEIITNIRHLLGVPLRGTFPDLFGVDYPARFVSSWLKDGSTHTADILTIFGISGIGKTSLAEYIYGFHCRLFQYSSFIDGINRKCREQSNNLLDLQKQLCTDISITCLIQVHDVSVYTFMIENALARKKVFLVLDDIDSLDQLDALLGNKGFYPGSKIIITTKDTSLVERCALFNRQVHSKHTKVLVEGLNETSSLQLLCFHAFKCIRPMEDYKQVSKNVVNFCEGHPLALKVLGRSLCGIDVARWEEYIEELKQETDETHIEKVLRISLESLPSQNDKEMFKHIACFFVGEDKEVTETILKACGIRTILGMKNLLNRCLLTIGPRNELMMHQLLQDMGREVVRIESRDKPWKRSRLWCHEESFNVLKQKKDKGNLKGLVLDMRILEKEKVHGSLELATDAMSTMDNLMLLQLNYVQIKGSYKNIPEELRWLCMHGFPLEYIPSDLRMENLVALDMSYSNFKYFDTSYSDTQGFEKRQKLTGSSTKDKRLFGSLKILNLSFCKQLRSLGGFSELPALERLIVTNCTSLIEVSESIEECVELVFIDLSYCNKLQKIPTTLIKLKKVKTLLLDGCDLLEFPMEIKDMDSLERLGAKNINGREALPGSSSSFSSQDHIYDVFLSYRGAAISKTFIDHLYKALLNAGINTFLHDTEIPTGEFLKPKLESAIKSSRASIIVLSENYAFSKWCLDELVLILEQHRNFNQIVIPIFYDIEPKDVRKQQNIFGYAMRWRIFAEKNAERKSQWGQKMEVWNRALTEVANLKGKYAKDREELEFIAEIVTDIRSRLRVPSYTLPHLIGMDYYIKFITSWLIDGSCHTNDVLTVLGVGGIGKTSLAKYVTRLHCLAFDKSSFIEDISRRCTDQYNGLLDLQKQLYVDISKPSFAQFHDVSVYTSKIENALARKKVLLILDDVDNLDQLNALLGNKGFHPGSKIIITTNDASLTERYTLFNPQVNPKHTTVLLKGLNEISSLEILSFYAFKGVGPREGYKQVSKMLVKFCEGNPLALKFLGMCLLNHDVAEWEIYIENLKKETDSCIEKVLRISFDSLPSENDKELFKHIACFFVGKDRDSTETILKECGIDTILGMRNLLARCLVTIGPRNELMMHQLLQDMGREVVRQESRYQPWKRSRIWCHEESFNVLKQKNDKGNLKGLVLDMRMLEKEKLHGSVELVIDTMSTMDNLMLLQLNYVQLNGSYKCFPRNLRWLCMHGFPLEYIPSDLRMENLVALDMSYSNFRAFDMSYSDSQGFEKRQKVNGSCSKDKGSLESLKILNLSFCYQLQEVDGFIKLPALERLILAGCRSLIAISESIELCHELVVIDLSYCIMLKSLPKTMVKLNKLEALSLDGCNLREFPTHMTDEDFQNIHIDSKADVNTHVTDKALPRDFKSFTVYLASSLLRDDNLCNNLISDGNPIVSLPNCVRSPPCTLGNFNVNRNIPPLDIALTIYSLAHSWTDIEGIVKSQSMEDVDEEVLRCLEWNDLDFIKHQEGMTWHDLRRKKKYQVQLFYEFGIFSTFYGGNEIPNWINDKRMGSSISFIMPSSNKNLRGLNFCHLQKGRDEDDGVNLLTIIVNNITKNRTWIYKHYIHWVKVDEECLIWLSHWMFGKNEMDDGDKVTITIADDDVSANVSVMECGVSFVYDDDGSMQQDPFCYYKSWNHIIGGDLSAFQLTTGEYFLDNHRFYWWHIDCPVYRSFLENGACYKEKGVYFRASPTRKSDILGGAHEDMIEEKELQPCSGHMKITTSRHIQ